MTKDLLPQPNHGVMDIAAYVPGHDRAPGVEKVYKLSANETPFGPSPKVVDALSTSLEGMEIYPDGSAIKLRQAIADAPGLKVANIMCGNGSDELLGLLCQTYLSHGDEAIYSEHGFLVYKIQILANGATPVSVPETNLHTDVDAMLAAVTPKTKMVFIANPNNPTGTYLPLSEVRRLHEGLPSNVILVLDAAYAEYVRKNDYEAGLELVSKAENVVMTRTFSKIYGLAALRIGWVYAPSAIIEAMDRVRGPFNVNSLALIAGATAVQDRTHLQMSIEHNALWLDRLTGEISALGLKVTPSVANFILIHFDEASDKNVVAANDFLISRGFVLRRVTSYGLPNALRLTIGSEETNLGVMAALKEFMS